MPLPDSNVWLAMALGKHVHHPAARSWFHSIDEARSVLFCRATQQSFLRLMTTAAILQPHRIPPLTNREAWAAYEALIHDDRIAFQSDEPPGVERLWKRLAARDAASPKLWMDAYLAALCITAGQRLVTTDRAFWQFEALDVLVLGER